MASADPKPAATRVSYPDPGEAAASFQRAGTRALTVPDMVARLRGGAAMVRWADPAAAFARYASTEFAEIGRELAAACEKIAAASLGPHAPGVT